VIQWEPVRESGTVLLVNILPAQPLRNLTAQQKEK